MVWGGFSTDGNWNDFGKETTMTMRNNFDKSSSGINIQAESCYDTMLSQDYFKWSIKEIKLNYKTRIFTYEDASSIEKVGDFCELSKDATRKDLVDLFDEIDGCYNEEDYTDEEIREEILNANPAMIQNRFWESRIGDTLKIKDGFTLYHTRGYCQGDIETVIYKGSVSDSGIKNEIDHLFWDAPVCAHVTINSNEFYYTDMSECDNYKWEKNKFIDYICGEIRDENCGEDLKKNRDYIRETLEKLLPDELAYE